MSSFLGCCVDKGALRYTNFNKELNYGEVSQVAFFIYLQIASANITEQTFTQPGGLFNLPSPLPLQPLSPYQVPYDVSTSMSSSHTLGSGRMPDHLSCPPNSVNDQSINLISPNDPSIQNCPTIITSFPSHTPGSWGSNSSQQRQMADISSGCECPGSQIPRYIHSQAHTSTDTNSTLGNLVGHICTL